MKIGYFVLVALLMPWLMGAILITHSEMQSVWSLNAKNYNVTRLEEGDLAASLSTYSKNNVLVVCFNAMNSLSASIYSRNDNLARAQICSDHAVSILKSDPTMALGWVIRAHTEFLKGAFATGAQYLEISQKIAPHESWLAEARVVVFLKAAQFAALDQNSAFLDDAELLFTSAAKTRWLARQWRVHELARPAIELALSQADNKMQRIFIEQARR